MAQSQTTGNRSSGTSLQGLIQQLKGFARAEIALSRQEMAGQSRELGVAGGMAGGAGLLGVLSAGTGTAGLVLLLARRMPPWTAALMVSGAYAGAAALLGLKARQVVEEVGVPAPDQAVNILKQAAGGITGS
ncbi:MAG: phage holin family protein [Actinomycetota bacterium]|nr:phage holin family protein [Actinomycetota bacterium]